jgi:alpha-galactosidase
MSQPNIVVIGAGSASFGPESVIGLAREPELHGGRVVLVDVDLESLSKVATLAERVNERYGARLEIQASVDRREALEGADYVIVSVEEGRIESWRKDWQLPIDHGMRHVMGENGGPGGLSHALRTIPLVLGICRDVEQIAPEAPVFNYTNPMSRVCMALDRYTDLNVVGLCHGVFYAYNTIAEVMGWVDPEESDTPIEEQYAQQRRVPELVEFEAAGLNHFTFITNMRDRRTGEDIYPEFKERFAPVNPNWDRFPRQVFDVFGLYPIQGNTHVGEYLGWAHGSQPAGLNDMAHRAHALEVLEGRRPLESLIDTTYDFPTDRAPAMIAAMVAARPQYELAVNIRNDGCIEGLPDWAIVEVPGIVSAAGVHGVAMGALPAGITALLAHEVAIQDRVVEAAVHGDREAALQALLLDPVSNKDYEAAVALLDAFLAEHAAYLPQFA